MAWWDIMLMVICLGLSLLFAVFGFFAVSSAKASVAVYKTDENIWKSLGKNITPGEATVVRMSRQAQRLTKAGSYGNNQVAATNLLLAYVDASGTRREATVSTFIETSLLGNFVEGKPVAIVYAADRPEIVAINRDRTMLEIPPSDLR
ncbi:hypothetical protein [Dyella silvatica]|uniref:hypothetical protein n=1 Tax=Dyella silvatica TaxID=2992128 RepID=UPI0022508FC0|nr:hypothetical protein [Dyella silvatica]